MKIIFAGTPTFAATALAALIRAGHEIVLVLTQPDRPAGRGMKITASAVNLLAQQHALTVLQPVTLKSPALYAQVRALEADVMIVAAYGLILPEALLTIPRYGCLNIHASLLPRWRGAAPIQRAILAGDRETGITIMQMDAGLDTGMMLLKQRIPIMPGDTAQTLHDKLCVLGAQCIVEGLVFLQDKKLNPILQDEWLACYASKIKKSEAEIDWRLTADQINDGVRAFNPNPGAYTYLQGSLLKIWQTRVVSGGVGRPGEIMAIGPDGIVVACGTGTILLEMVQKQGGRKLKAAEFLTGYQTLQPGDCFSSGDRTDTRND